MYSRCGMVAAVLFLFVQCLAQSASDPTVYVTRTGAKYHRATCSSLRSSSIPMALSEAVQSYSSCSRCNPPSPSANSSDAASLNTSGTATPRVQSYSGSKAQCLGITKKGLQCKRTTSDPSGYCYQHTNQASASSVVPSSSATPSRSSSIGIRVQCSGITKKGARCKRMTSDPSGYCYQHQ